MDTVQPFTRRAAVASYPQDTPRKVPGYADLHRMAELLLAEHAPAAGRILVYGAGGGAELRAFAQARPGWQLVGVDPSAEMLELARDVLGSAQSQVTLVHGYIDDVPEQAFDGATCLLTLHFIPLDERLRVLRAIHDRLAPDARLVVAHHVAPPETGATTWLERSIAFAERTGSDPARVSASADTMRERLPLVAPDADEALLRRAGYRDPAMFYAAFSFRGWVATA